MRGDGLMVPNNLAMHDSYLDEGGGLLESVTSCNLIKETKRKSVQNFFGSF